MHVVDDDDGDHVRIAHSLPYAVGQCAEAQIIVYIKLCTVDMHGRGGAMRKRRPKWITMCNYTHTHTRAELQHSHPETEPASRPTIPRISATAQRAHAACIQPHPGLTLIQCSWKFSGMPTCKCTGKLPKKLPTYQPLANAMRSNCSILDHHRFFLGASNHGHWIA